MLSRWNAAIEKRMAFVTPACLILGVLFPEIAGKGLPLVPVMFAVMTFIGALKSSFRDVGRVFQNPLPLLLAIGFLHVLMPTAACAAGHLFFTDNRPDHRNGPGVFGSRGCGGRDVGVHLSGKSIYGFISGDPGYGAGALCDPGDSAYSGGSKGKDEYPEMMSELVFMIALPAILAMCLNQWSGGRVKEFWPPRLAFFSKLCLMFVVTANSSKVAPYVRHLNGERAGVALCILLLAAAGYFLGYGAAAALRMKREDKVSVMYGSGMRNISAGAVIAAAYFPGEVMFPVMIGTLFQQVLAVSFGTLLLQRRQGIYGKEKKDGSRAQERHGAA